MYKREALEMGNVPLWKAGKLKKGNKARELLLWVMILSPLVDKTVHSIFSVRANVPPLIEDRLTDNYVGFNHSSWTRK